MILFLIIVFRETDTNFDTNRLLFNKIKNEGVMDEDKIVVSYFKYSLVVDRCGKI